MMYHLATDTDNDASATKIACSAKGWRGTRQWTFSIHHVTCSNCKATKEYQEGCIVIDATEEPHMYNPWIVHCVKQGRMLVFKSIVRQCLK